MSEPAYPAARAIAPKVRAHFARHVALAPPHIPTVLPAPTEEDVEALVETGFWTSLRREEVYVPKVSLALTPPSRVEYPMLFTNPLPFTSSTLVKVAPAVERPGIHLGVWRVNGELTVWGTTRIIPAYAFVLEVAAPGLLVIKHHRGDGGKYVNVAVLEGDQIKMIDQTSSQLPDCPGLLSSLLGFDTPGEWDGPITVLVDLAVSMRAHGRGGIMLVAPNGEDTWVDSMVQPIPYRLQPPSAVLADLLRRADAEHKKRGWQEELEDAVQTVAGLTAVDGATVLDTQCNVLAFGAKISRREGSPIVERMSLTEPIEGGEAALVHAAYLGGTRHLAAAQFVHDQRNAMAMVASQDGRFTIFAWSPCEERVHAHRVEALLL